MKENQIKILTFDVLLQPHHPTHNFFLLFYKKKISVHSTGIRGNYYPIFATNLCGLDSSMGKAAVQSY
jgi:hypothetical protein